MSNRRVRPGRASIIVGYTWSTIFEDSDLEDERDDDKDYKDDDKDYKDGSVSEVSQTFTIKCHKNSQISAIDIINEDTDIEDDDEFNEISTVTFEKEDEKAVVATPRIRKSTIVNQAHPMITPHNTHKCATQCASTYQFSRERRRRAVSTVVSPTMHLHDKKIISTSEDTSIDESADELSKLRVRKKSKFNPQKHKTKLIEGTFKLMGSKNYEEFLSAVGTGPCSQDMVMRADMVMFITQEHDKQWRIANETLIKAKSIRGYRTNNRKWTENKFKVKHDFIKESPASISGWRTQARGA